MRSTILAPELQSPTRDIEAGCLVVFEDYEGKRYGASVERLLPGGWVLVRGNDQGSKYWAVAIPRPIDKVWPAI